MVRTRGQAVVNLRLLFGSALEQQPTILEFIGTGKYLHLAISKSVARLYAAKFGTRTNTNIAACAAQHGSLSFLKWAVDVRGTLTGGVYLRAVEGGLIPNLDFLLKTFPAFSRCDKAFKVAADAGKIETLEWLWANNFEWGDWEQYQDWIGAECAMRGDLETLQWLHHHGMPWCYWCPVFAAAGGRINVVDWLKTLDLPWSNMAMPVAAARGQLQVLMWGMANGCLIDSQSCSNAASGGALNVLMWLRSQNVPWGTDVCSNAANAGHLELLQWARSQGCPWDAYTLINAQVKGHTDIATWALENGCPHHVQIPLEWVPIEAEDVGNI